MAFYSTWIFISRDPFSVLHNMGNDFSLVDSFDVRILYLKQLLSWKFGARCESVVNLKEIE